MSSSVFFILEIFGMLLLVLFLIPCVLWLWTSLRAKVPFIPVPKKTLIPIAHALDIDAHSVVYDLGCGDARVLLFLARQVPQAHFIGIENGIFPRLTAQLFSWWSKRKGRGIVEVVNKDFFTVDLSDATHIFVYLYGSVMNELFPKFERELRPGTRVVSAAFEFSKKKPVAHIVLEGDRYDIVKDLYVYEF